MPRVVDNAADLGTPTLDGVFGEVRIGDDKQVVMTWNIGAGTWVAKPEITSQMLDQMPMGITSSGYLQGSEPDDNIVSGGLAFLNPEGLGFPLNQINDVKLFYDAGLRLQERLTAEIQWDGVSSAVDIYVNWFEMDVGGSFLASVPLNPGVKLFGVPGTGAKYFKCTGWQNSPALNVAPTHPIFYPNIYGHNLERVRGFMAERRWVAGNIDHGVPGDGSSTIPPHFDALTYWFNADYVPGGNNAPVTEWPDFSGYSRPITQVTGTKKPTKKLNAVNGHASVLFDGVNDFMQQVLGDMANTSNSTSFLVVKQYADGGDPGIWVDGKNASYLMYRQGNEVHVWSGQSGGDVIYNRGAGAWPSPFLVINQTTGTTNTKLYEGKTLKTTGNPSGGGPFGLSMGAERHENAGTYAHCEISEFLLYADILTDVERETVIDHLNTKYGLS